MDIFEQTDAAFAGVPTVAVSATATSVTPRDPPYAPENAHLFKRRLVPAMYAGCEVGSEGLEREIVLDEARIFAKDGCRALRETLITGGAADDNPRWHLKLFAVSFLNKPRVLAHALGNKHPKYTPAGTEAEMDRVDKDRSSRTGGMGWPGCDKFEQAGCTECALCPHRGKIRSPLNLAIVKQELVAGEQPAETHSTVTFAGNELLPGCPKYALPDGYAFNAKGHVCVILELKEKTADGIEVHTELVPMLDNQYILNPTVQQTPDAIIFWVDGSKGELREVILERGTGSSSPQESLKRLGEQGVRYNVTVKNRLGDFLMSLLGKIEQIRASTKARPFGWMAAIGGGYDAFIYGKTFHRNGTETAGAYLDDKMRNEYAPIGAIAPWIETTDLLVEDATARGRMNYICFLASAFAGPLMVFTQHPLVWLSLPGETGSGKSTILKCAAAVWGHPEYSRLVYEPTLYSAATKMGTIANITIYFDEVTDEPSLDNALKLQMMDGSDRARMQSTHGRLSNRDTKHWQTLLATCGNRSALDFVAVRQQDTNMGRMRIFELPWAARDDTPRIARIDVEELIKSLRFNYGQAGLVYAKFLAMKSAGLNDMVRERNREFDKLVGARTEERFWSTICATLLLGAEIARDLGLVKFDLPAMQKYLAKCFLEQREKLAAADQDGLTPAIELLTAFMKDHQQSMLVTSGLPERGGDPNRMPFNILRQPTIATAKGIHIQWVKREVNPILRISRKKLQEWLTANKHQPSVVFSRIPHRTTPKVVMGGKTVYAAGPERVMEMDVVSGSWLAAVLADITGTEEAPAPTPAGDAEKKILAAAEVAKQKDKDHEG